LGVKILSEKVKGIKGMQKRLWLFLAVFAIFNAASSQSSRRPGGSAQRRRPLAFSPYSNVATIDDIVAEAPNVAIIPETADVIYYDVPAFPTPAEIETAAPAARAKKPVPEKKAAPARAMSAAKSRGVSDRFADIRVNDGEEVLVFATPSVPAQKKSASKNAYAIIAQAAEPADKAVPGEKEANPNTVAKAEGEPAAVPAPGEKEASPNNVASANDSPFEIEVSGLTPAELGLGEAFADRAEIADGPRVSQGPNPFLKAFSAVKPDDGKGKGKDKKKKAKDQKGEAPAAAPSDAPAAKPAAEKVVSYASSRGLKDDLYRTYMSDNRYLSPVEYVDGRGVDAGQVQSRMKDAKKMVALPSGPLKVGSREVLQMKLDFEPTSSAVSGESVNIIRSFAQIATDMPTNSIEIGIPESVMNNPKKKKLAARRLAIVSNVLRNAGLSDRQIYPVLSARDPESFSFRVIGNDKFDTLRISKGTDIFGEEESVQQYNLMRW
jgi:hypothetical protein